MCNPNENGYGLNPYNGADADEDEVFSEQLKSQSQRVRSAELARLANVKLGKRPDRPMLVDFAKLEALGVKIRRTARYR